MVNTIRIRGARTHNLKNISLDIPRNQFVVITGLSGSGKSSLAFDTLYAEGQRRYVESLSTYARQFLSLMEKPDVDSIEGLSPAIAIEQKSTSHNPRSTVGTVTEIYDYLRLLFARVGIARCPVHNYPLITKPIGQIADEVLVEHDEALVWVLAPVIRNRKGEHTQLIADWQKQGFTRARIDGTVVTLDASVVLNGKKAHTIELVIDRLKLKADQRQRLVESMELASKMSEGLVIIHRPDQPEKDQLLSERMACPDCGYALGQLEPKMFSFNSPIGACESCLGIGTERKLDVQRMIRKDLTLQGGAIMGWDHQTPYYHQLIQSILLHYGRSMEEYWDELPEQVQHTLLYGSGTEKINISHDSYWSGAKKATKPFIGVIPMLSKRVEQEGPMRQELLQLMITTQCHKCQGARLKEAARHVWVQEHTLSQITQLSIDQCKSWIDTLEFSPQQQIIAAQIIKEISGRLSFLDQVGLDYLTLNRPSETLSGGEAQRIRLATQIGSALVGVMYVLDEPSIGLHQRDNARLITTLKHLRDLGNSVIVVEHDEEAIMESDQLIDIGPHAGIHGGELICQGTPLEILNHPTSLTAQYLSGRKDIIPERGRVSPGTEWIRLSDVNYHNLQHVDISLPIGCFVVVTGVSGSGKSTLINDTLSPWIHQHLGLIPPSTPPVIGSLSGHEHFDKVIDIDQSPIGRTPRSNPATYIGLFQGIRDLFTQCPESRARGYAPGRFSFNVSGGRCESCSGDGVIKVEMHFLSDVYVTCEVCNGKRYNQETLEITYRGKNISDVLNMTVEEACTFFDKHPSLKRKLETLVSVGLGYIRLGQNATTLSGGEAQRMKLSRELSKRATGKTLYLLDEPTTGLHFLDVQLLLDVLLTLRDQGNTLIVIEHHMDMIRWADWIIDMGPEGGHRGGKLVAEGTPETVMATAGSHTGHFLKAHLDARAKHAKVASEKTKS